MPTALTKGSGSKVFSGSRAIFLFNGTPIAFASGVDGSEEIQYQPVEVLDKLEVVEHVPVGYRTTLSCAVFRTVKVGASTDQLPGSLRAQAVWPKQVADILTVDGVDCLIMDRISNQTLFAFENVKAASYRFSVTARGLVAQNITFVCIRAKDDDTYVTSTAAAG